MKSKKKQILFTEKQPILIIHMVMKVILGMKIIFQQLVITADVTIVAVVAEVAEEEAEEGGEEEEEEVKEAMIVVITTITLIVATTTTMIAEVEEEKEEKEKAEVGEEEEQEEEEEEEEEGCTTKVEAGWWSRQWGFHNLVNESFGLLRGARNPTNTMQW